MSNLLEPKENYSKQPITIHDPPKDTEMPTLNALKVNDTNKQPEEMLVANDDDAQDTNKQSQGVAVQSPNFYHVIIDNAQYNMKVFKEDQVTHNSNDVEVLEANDVYEHLRDQASSYITYSEAVSSR